MERINHGIEPVFDENSKILILGTFPSVKSRETEFFYGNPQNRFWSVLAALTGWEVPTTIEEKKRLLLENKIAVWDVVESCEIKGSSDSTIKEVIPNDISRILDVACIRAIYGNGLKACELYQKYTRQKTGREIIKLPSTSPANAAYRLERLIEEWKSRIGNIS
jgi:hypoxanthine-DNA glycosylase